MASSTNGSQSALNNFTQKIYADFSGGYNDTSLPISIEDNQLSLSENVDYAAEAKALQTRKGCVKINTTSFGKDVTDGYAWMIGSVHKKCIVMNSTIYDVNTNYTGVVILTDMTQEDISKWDKTKIYVNSGETYSTYTTGHWFHYDKDQAVWADGGTYSNYNNIILKGMKLLSTGAKHIYPFVMYNTLYFGDGSKLYEWGHFDYASELGKKVVKRGTIVKCNDATLGVKGHFYKYVIGTSGLVVNNLPDTLTRYKDNIPDTITVIEDGQSVTKTVTRSLFNPMIIEDMSEEDVSSWNTNKIYVNLGETYGSYTTNHWFYYSNSTWTDGGTYRTQETVAKVNMQTVDFDGATTDMFSWDRTKIYVNTGEPDGILKANHWFYYNAPDWEDGGAYTSEEGVLIDLSVENYLNVNKWSDATDVPEYSSDVVRELEPYDPSQNEVVRITIYSSATTSGTLKLCLNDVVKSAYISFGTTVSSILNSLNNMSFDEWTSKIISQSTIEFTCDLKKECNAGYIDNGTTGIQCVYSTVQEGSSSNCDLTDIKKCTIFCVHQGSSRVFAAGNPDDNAVYYSEIGYGNYFKSSVNKLYPAINGYGHVTGMINLSNSLLVSYENGWYSWRGITPLSDAQWEPLNIPYGCVSSRTICLTPQSFTFLAKDGIYNVSAAILNDQYILLQTKQILRKISEDVIEKTIDTFNDVSLCTAVFYDNMYLLAYSTNGEYCDRVLKYEWDTGAFTLYTGWKVNNWLNDHDNLFFASENYLLKAFEGYSDIDISTGDAKPIQVHVKTKDYYFDTPQTNKVVQMIAFIFRQYEKLESDAQIILHCGYQKYVLKKQDLAESLYYGRRWGRRWGHNETMVQVAEIVMVSNTFQIELIANNLNDPITLLGIGFSYADTDLVLPTILKDEDLLK